MILEQPKPIDVEIYNKMTPFFNIFLDDVFQSCHYGNKRDFSSSGGKATESIALSIIGILLNVIFTVLIISKVKQHKNKQERIL